MNLFLLFVFWGALVIGAIVTTLILYFPKQPNDKTVHHWNNGVSDVTTNAEVVTERDNRRVTTHYTHNRRITQNKNEFPFPTTYDGYQLFHIDAGTRATDGRTLLLITFTRNSLFYMSEFEADDKSFRSWSPVFTLIPLHPSATGYCRLSPSGDKFLCLMGSICYVLSYDSANNAFATEAAANMPSGEAWVNAEWDSENNDEFFGMSNTAGLFRFNGTTVSIFAFNVRSFSQHKHHLAYVTMGTSQVLFATRPNASTAFTVDATRTMSLTSIYNGRHGTSDYYFYHVFVTGIVDQAIVSVSYKDDQVFHMVFLKYTGGAWVKEKQEFFKDSYLRAATLPVGHFFAYSHGKDLQLCDFGQIDGDFLFHNSYLGTNWNFSATVDHQGGKNSLVVIPFSTDQIFGAPKEETGYAHAMIFVRDLI